MKSSNVPLSKKVNNFNKMHESFNKTLSAVKSIPKYTNQIKILVDADFFPGWEENSLKEELLKYDGQDPDFKPLFDSGASVDQIVNDLKNFKKYGQTCEQKLKTGDLQKVFPSLCNTTFDPNVAEKLLDLINPF